MPGVSDTFAATLWAVDWLFNLASIGGKGMNFHGGGTGPYTAIGYKSQATTVPEVRPLYYAMWFFSNIARTQARITEPQVTSSNKMIKIWSTEDAKGITTVTVIHKDMTATAPAVITIKPTKRLTTDAQLYILESKTGLNTTYGIYLAGQTFDGSTGGLPVGRQATVPVTPDMSGNYVFKVEVTSIALLMLPTQ